MFGRQPRLPVDISFGLDNTKQTNGEKQPMSSYVSYLKNRLEKAHELTLKATKTAQEKQKTCYDKRVRGNNIEVGDRVLVKILAFDGKHKLSNEWEEHPYIIPSKPNPDIPVFIVQKENGEGRQRNLHRNLLLPVEIFNSEDHVESKPVPAPRKKRNIPDSNRHPVVLERMNQWMMMMMNRMFSLFPQRNQNQCLGQQHVSHMSHLIRLVTTRMTREDRLWKPRETPLIPSLRKVFPYKKLMKLV